MATSAVTTVIFDQPSRTLRIIESDAADSVAIVQNDRVRALTVTSLGAHGATSEQRFSSNLVSRVIVQMGDGADLLEYRTTHDVFFAKDLQVDLGAGDDKSFPNFAARSMQHMLR
jgi:hypothetical protein